MSNDRTRAHSDYYSLLGVPRNVDKDGLKRAFKKKARENHPDRLRHLPEKEREEREERMYALNEAYGVLSDNEKRQAYDKYGKEGVRRRSAEGRTGGVGINYDDFFSSLFGESGIFGRENIFGGWGSLWGDLGIKQEAHFMIPDNDLGLLAALKKAYEAKEDGKWRVRKAGGDKRDWMPEEIYSVKREGDKVLVFRIITDWRNTQDRKKKIQVKKEGSYWQVEKEMAPNTFLGEYYLYGRGRDRLADSYKIPYQFGEYLQAMKSLARKFARKETDAEGRYDVGRELRAINSYGEFGSKNTRIEGRLLWADDEDREWVRDVSFDDFWERMRQAEGSVVQKEGGPPKTKEGRRKTPKEGVSSSHTGGETKG